MADKGTKKRQSEDHERHIASLYDGWRSPSSGASPGDSGDVRCDDTLIECKSDRRSWDAKRKPKLVSLMEKISDEALEEDKDPALALRWYWPDSPLANHQGWVDLTVRLSKDDAAREGPFRV